MNKYRIIPNLLLKGQGLYKTKKYNNPVYLGDPMNILKIFNEKEVDEICLLDIDATPNAVEPQFDYLSELSSECFMPLAYGGGINKIDQIQKILQIGVEKCILGTAFHNNPQLIQQAVKEFGSQSIIVSLDVKKNLFGKYTVYSNCGKENTKKNPCDSIKEAEQLGAGEILLNAIDRDGVMNGYDIELLKRNCNIVSIPVIANGGASCIDDFQKAIQAGASAISAGAMFVFTGPHRAVLINVPKVC